MPVEVVREPLGKTVLKNSGTDQNVLVLIHSFWITCKCSAFDFKEPGTHQTVLVSIHIFWITRKRSAFDFKDSGTHQNVLFSIPSF
jgi:hypothetical protein